MAGLGGFLQGVGLGIGNNIQVGLQVDKQKISNELGQQQVQMNQMSILANQRKLQTEKDVGDYISSEVQKDASVVTDPVKMAQTFSKAAGLAIQHGDFAGAEEMSKLAEGKNKEAKDNAVLLAQQTQLKKEDLSNAASTYTDSPSPEGAKDLAAKAVAAGINPVTIPAPGTPAFAAWASKQQLASMDGKEKAQFVQKAYEVNANRELRAQEHADSLADRQEARRQTAGYQQAMVGLRAAEIADRRADRADKAPTTKTVGDAEYEWDPSGSKPGDRDIPDKGWVKLGDKSQRQGVQQQRDTAALAGSSAEALRNLRQMSRFGIGTVSSPFGNLTDHTALSALTKAGANAFTPEQAQMFTSAGAGLANQVARIETLGGGRGANQSQINQLEKQLTPTAGDTPLEQVYKVSTAAELVLTRMKNQPAPKDPELKAEWDKTKEELSKYPKTEDILNVSNNPTLKRKLLGMSNTYSSLLAKINDSVDLPGGADPGKGTNAPPLPAGWSVKEH